MTDWKLELEKCIGEGYGDVAAFLHTCKYLHIPRKKDRAMVCLADVITPLQIQAVQDVADHGQVFFLKSRKEGISTIIAAWNFRHLWLIENYEVVLMALDDGSTQYLKTIYQMFHDGIPEQLMEGAGFDLASSAHRMQYFRERNGNRASWSSLRAMTASSDTARGSTPNAIHFSEFAQYRDIQRTLDATSNSAVDDCEIIYETTARGMNRAYEIWNEPDNGIHKSFISWIDSPNCTKPKKKGKTPAELEDVARELRLKKKSVNWATDRFHQRCGSNWAQFSQEYPWKPEVAFVSSGTRFFAPLYFSRPDPFEGIHIIEEYSPGELYTLGADTASGSPQGDYSAYVMLKCTNPLDPKIVATYRQRLETPLYAQEIYSQAKVYKPLIVPEVNGNGIDLIWRLKELGYPHLYQRVTSYDKTGEALSKQAGWHTGDKRGGGGSRTIMLSRLLSHVRGGEYYGERLEKLDLSVCERIKSEVNTFVYTKSGKVEHDVGCHDDLLMALAMALMGMDQVHEAVEVIRPQRPRTLEELLLWEQKGKTLDEVGEDYWDDETYREVEEPELFPRMSLDLFSKPSYKPLRFK